jgi:hypothetical protein
MRQNKFFAIYIALALTCLVTSVVAAKGEDKFKYPFYAGITGGYGWTTWGRLTPAENNQNFAISMSTPNYATENGALWGGFAGYELLPYFALEASYMRYPDATVSFDSMSLFSFEHNGLTHFITKTEVAAMMGKIMLIIPTTSIRAYSSLGIAELHRSDEINNSWTTHPTFGAGFNYNFTEHIMAELGASYTAGEGEVELSPAEDYVPFLYSVFLRLAYRF